MSCTVTPADAVPCHYIMARDAKAYLRYPGPNGMIVEGLPRDFIERHLAVGDRCHFTDAVRGRDRVMKFYEVRRWGEWEADE